MLEKICDLYAVEPHFVIELKNGEQKKIEINKLNKISISFVKRKKTVSSVMLMILFVLNLAFIDSLQFKITLTALLIFLFILIHTLLNKQYKIIIELKNKKVLKYVFSLRKKCVMKENVLEIKNLQIKHNFKKKRQDESISKHVEQ